MEKMHVTVLFGGASSEYEISCLSAFSVIEGLETLGHTVHKIGITRSGSWRLYEGPTSKIKDATWHEAEYCVPATVSPDALMQGFLCMREAVLEIVKTDVFFPVLHGRNGEDGTVQGLLDLAQIPYVGCGVLASAACMDKVAANTFFDAVKIPQAAWMWLSAKKAKEFETSLPFIKEKLSYPIFVKPSVGGSSVGISKAKDDEELKQAILLAAKHDSKIVFEQSIVGKEVECAVIGNDAPFSSLPGEVESCHEVYDYEAKYQSDGESKLHLPARISKKKQEEVRDLAVKAYEALGCEGLSRVDFFVENETEEVLINEINTMPGFTSISMYAKLMEMSGVPFGELLNKLLELALERKTK